ncbi:MAG: protein translocase subunit SecD [Pirellulaceae bacterium]
MLDSVTLPQIMLIAQEATPPNKPLGASGYTMFALLIGALFLSIWLANMFAKSLRMSDVSGRLAVIFSCIAIAIVSIAFGWPPKFGVDLRGGVNMIGQLNFSKFEGQDQSNLPTADKIIPKLKQRVDPSGLLDVSIRSLGDDKIEVTIPDVTLAQADSIWKRLVKTGHLQFRIVATSGFHPNAIQRAEQKIKAGDLGRTIAVVEDDGSEKVLARWYDLARVQQETPLAKGDVAAMKFVPDLSMLVRDKRTGQIVNMNEVAFSTNDPGKDFAIYLKSKGIRTAQILLMEPVTEDSDVEGKHLDSVSAVYDDLGKPCIAFDLTKEGGRRMGHLTLTNKPIGERFKQLAIVLDDALVSAPRIEEPIFGRGRITGKFTPEEVEEMVANLKSGKIDVALVKTPISQQYTLSTLGEELARQGVWAIAISLVIVLLFMLFYYKSFAGTLSCVAMFLNLIMVLAMVILIKQPITLTGLAGLVLTIGMAVDANVLIFERIREELERGAALRMAIRNGFDKATTTIVDANVTTLITALVLYGFGTEQIKGFSVTLILGILTSMFTAVYCSRLAFEIAEKKRWITKLSMRQLFPAGRFNFLGKQFIAITMSALLIGIGIVSMYSLGDKILDIDLRGGSTARVIFNEETTTDNVRDLLSQHEIKFNDEVAAFVVTELTDENFPKRLFKIDSTLPAPSEANGDTWQPLDRVLEEILPGKLRLHNVQFDANSIKTVELDAQGNEIGMVVPRQIESSAKRIAGWQVSPTAFVPASWTHSLVSADPVQDQENQSETATTTQDETVDNTQGGENSEATSEAIQSSDAPAATQQNELSQENTVINKRYRSTLNLKFDNPIMASSISTLLSDTAAELDIDLDEEQIYVSAPGVSQEDEESESGAAEMRTDWQVSIDSTGQENAKLILDDFSKSFNTRAYFPATSEVGQEVSLSSQKDALLAIFLSLLGIIIYVWVRFQSLAFGLAAVLALVHDVLVVLGLIAICNYIAGFIPAFVGIEEFKISLTVLAAILTVIGYSLNDTIVIFDRVREVRGKRSELTSEMINQSISQTMGRTILTSFTTFIVVFILFAFGGPSIHAFAFSLVVGIIAGTYSTIFIASPALLWFIGIFGVTTEETSEAAKA